MARFFVNDDLTETGFGMSRARRFFSTPPAVSQICTVQIREAICTSRTTPTECLVWGVDAESNAPSQKRRIAEVFEPLPGSARRKSVQSMPLFGRRSGAGAGGAGGVGGRAGAGGGARFDLEDLMPILYSMCGCSVPWVAAL